MTYEEKGVWTYLVVSVAVYVGYVVVILGRADGGPVADVPYVAPLLWSIGISVAGNIVARILVEILRPSDAYTADVRDKQIARLGNSVAAGVLGVGMVGPFVLALLGAPHFWIANAMYLVFVAYAVTDSVVRIVAYRRGM